MWQNSSSISLWTLRTPGRFSSFDQCYLLFSAACSSLFQKLFTFIIFEPESIEFIRIDLFPGWSFKILLLVIFHYHLMRFSFIRHVFFECLECHQCGPRLSLDMNTSFWWLSLQRQPRLEGERPTFTCRTIVCMFTRFSCECGFSNDKKKCSFFWIIDTLKNVTGCLEPGSWGDR